MQKGFAPIIIVVGILVVILAGYILLIGFPENKKCGQVLTCHGIPFSNRCLGYKSTFAYKDCGITNPLITPTPIPDETANWKIYTDVLNKFSFKYPDNWGKGDSCLNEDRKGFVGVGPELYISPYADCGTANIPPTAHFYIVNGKMTPKDYEIKEQKIITIDNIKSDYIVYKIRNSTIPGTYIDSEKIHIYIPVNNYYLFGSLENSKYQKEFDQVLSTFKFLDQDQTGKLVPADSQTPVAGACSGPSTDPVVTVTVGLDNVPQPRCTKVTADQKLKIVNNSNQVIQDSIGQYTINITPGQKQLIDASLGTYLAPGVHNIAGAEIWLQK